MSLDSALFDYHLPDEAIAQVPAAKRDQSLLMVIDRKSRRVEHRRFFELPNILADAGVGPVDFFRNTAKVIKARMFLQRSSGAQIELLLLRPSTTPNNWWCLARHIKKVKLGETIVSAQGEAIAKLLELGETGEALFEFTGDPLEISERIGKLPLPPYISREKIDPRDQSDNDRYQTVFAKEPVAAAAPTAGLHFTPELLANLEADGHRFHDLALHVGLDTFRPISAEIIEEHKIHTETYQIAQPTAQVLQDPKAFKLAVGTTSLRTIEDYTRNSFPEGEYHAASLFVYPPQTIQSADALITNFHLPKSTLMCLVSAFLRPASLEGIDWLKEIYAEALQKGYRFYSYGDAMLIL